MADLHRKWSTIPKATPTPNSAPPFRNQPSRLIARRLFVLTIPNDFSRICKRSESGGRTFPAKVPLPPPDLHSQKQYGGKQKGNIREPIDSAKKSSSSISCRTPACLLYHSTERASGCSGARWRLSGGQYGRRTSRPFKPHHWRVQHGGRFSVAPERHCWPVEHGDRRWDAPCQYRRQQHGHWRWGPS